MPFPRLTAEAAAAALAAADTWVAPGALAIERREERRLIRLPGQRQPWFAASPAGARELALERRVLPLLTARCSFEVSRVLAVGAGGDLDVRAEVPGSADPWTVFERVRTDAGLAARIGAAVGAILVEQHTRVAAADVVGWLPLRAGWPEEQDWIRPRLARVVADDELVARAKAVLDRYDAEPVVEDNRVLVHADLGLHNLAIDPASLPVRGVFDYGGAA